MTTKTLPSIIRLAHEPKDRAAISAALAQLEANATAQQRQLTIIAPEVSAIRRDASGYGSTERVVEGFMRNPANSKTQLAIALRALYDLQRQVRDAAPAIIADAEAMEEIINQTTTDLINQARTKVEMHLQAFFTPANLPAVMNRATVVQNAMNLAQRVNPQAWGFSMTNMINDASGLDGRNSASDLVRQYRAQLRTLNSAQEGIEEVAKQIEAL